MLGFIFDHISEKVFNFMFIVTLLQHQRPAECAPRGWSMYVLLRFVLS